MPESLKGLLDVNVLIAHAIVEHEHHRRVVHWHRKLPKTARLFSCPITELGLIRNVMRILGVGVDDARTLLDNERKNLRLTLVPDTLSGGDLPHWVQGYRQTTDAYLSELAKHNGLRFVTLDKQIPASLQILG